MDRALFELAARLCARGEAFALATVVARKPPISARVGDTALITAAGEFHGWLGGSCTRPTAIAEARAALLDGRPRVVILDPEPDRVVRPGARVFAMTCHSGGSVEMVVQPVLPAPRLLVYGGSPVARTLTKLGRAMGYRVFAIEPESDTTTFPEADVVIPDPGSSPLGPAESGSPTFAVVATQGQWDEEAIVAALHARPDYLGVVASRRRFAEVKSLLLATVPAADLDRIKNPAGLDLGAEHPEEIAASILAQIVAERCASAKDAPATKPDTEREEARDPVCGMTVVIREGAHRATHAGRDFFFCCAGCKTKFLADPERYLSAEPSV